MNNSEQKSLATQIGKHLRTRLVSGVIVLIPLAVTLFILNLLFSSLAAFVRPLLHPWLGELPEYGLTLIALGVTATRLNDIVRGRRGITADTALRLGIYFGLPAQFWLNLQNEYDLRRAAVSPALKRVAPRAA